MNQFMTYAHNSDTVAICLLIFPAKYVNGVLYNQWGVLVDHQLSTIWTCRRGWLTPFVQIAQKVADNSDVNLVVAIKRLVHFVGQWNSKLKVGKHVLLCLLQTWRNDYNGVEKMQLSNLTLHFWMKSGGVPSEQRRKFIGDPHHLQFIITRLLILRKQCLYQ